MAVWLVAGALPPKSWLDPGQVLMAREVPAAVVVVAVAVAALLIWVLLMA